MTFAWEELYKHETPRGGRYLAHASCSDLRRRGAWLARCRMPTGADGDCGLDRSVSGLRHPRPDGHAQVGGQTAAFACGRDSLLNIRFQKQFVGTQTGLEACAH